MAGTTTIEGELSDPKLLDKIDKLFEANIGEYVELPQLLVVGDQSSGKSSVLEGLTGLPFPRDKTLCTCFATQITFRRVLRKKISVSIVPAGDANHDHTQKLRAWKRDNIAQLTQQMFAEIMVEVRTIMGVSKSGSEDGEDKPSFSDDILKVEICGPEEQYLSVIDVPGIFRKKTAGVTTEEDKIMVKRMVSTYMKNHRSVILAIIPANVDIATQEILEMAEEHDPNGHRTLGVLTKPDLVDPGAENEVINIIKGRNHALRLGWCIVVNPGQKALDSQSLHRHAEEKPFFATKDPWIVVPKDRAGIEALRIRLVGILGEMIEQEFPKVKAEISQRLKLSKQDLKRLGPSRDTKDQQYAFVLDLATRFQKTANLALNAQYGGDEIFESLPNLRLATSVVNRNETFDEDVWKKGHKMTFDNFNQYEKSKYADEAEEEGEDSTDESSVSTTQEEDLIPVRNTDNFWELEDILYDGEGIYEPEIGGIKEWLEEVYRSSRGFELGTFDANLLPIIWKKQSANWDALGLGYISDIVCIVHGFIVGLLSKLCDNARVERGLRSVLLDNLIEKYKRSIDHASFVLAVERAVTPLTTNHYFADNLETCRQERIRSAIQSKVVDSRDFGSVVRFSDIASKTASSNREHTIDDLHDILKSYYKVARKRFVDVMCMQSADYHLVTGPDTPIKIFSPAFVTGLSSDQLELIAGEDAASKKKRNDLKHHIEILENGRKILI